MTLILHYCNVHFNFLLIIKTIMRSINVINNLFFNTNIIILGYNFFNKTGSCNLSISIENI